MKQEKGKKKKKSIRKNSPIIFTMAFFSCLFVALLCYFGIYVKNNARQLIDNNYNSRQNTLRQQNVRGSIYARDGAVLAETIVGDDGSETRNYPYGSLFAHSVGYLAKGRSGLESAYQSYLINADIPLYEQVEHEAAGEKNQGDSLYTSLDVGLQETASKALGVFKGAVIVMEPKTGRILALVSKPDFDPNQLDQNWDSYLSDADSSVLFNRALSGLYPPGSTFKIATALEYIRENPDHYSDFRFSCNGSFSHSESTIHCFHGSTHGSVDFKEAFAESCNSAFASIGVGLDRESYADSLDDLFMNRELALELPSKTGSMTIDPEISDDEMMQLAIGQGRAQVSPIQLCMITCGIANNGLVMTPTFVDHIDNADGDIVKQIKPTSYQRIMSEEEASVLRELMGAVVTEGTGRKLSGLSYTAAGKTGSAEYHEVKGDSHAWFTGYAPADDPEIAVTVIVEGLGSGSDYAVPIAKRVFDAYFGVGYGE